MYSYETSIKNNIIKVTPLMNNNRITWREIVELFQSDMIFINSLVSTMNNLNISKYKWETSPANPDLYFDFVIIEDAKLSSYSNPTFFISEIMSNKYSQHISCFEGTSGKREDSILIVPRGKPNDNIYAHLGSFLRFASIIEIQQLFYCIGDTLEKLLVWNKTYWLNSGVNVPWLHIKIDQTSKYYLYDEYKT